MTSPIHDTSLAGLARGWRVTDASTLKANQNLEYDVVIIGSGAGGGMAAESLARRGLSVVLIEEGGLLGASRFRMDEALAYPELYQESAGRQTADKAITILQGRTVGGSTTVNWTSSFRTPATTLAWWRDAHGLAGLTDAEMAPWFAQVEARLSIDTWALPPNPNNSVLEKGCAALGLSSSRMQRNVKGCWNLGYCGMGCPTNAKQSMLVTTIPAALDAGAHLLTRTRAERLLLEGRRVTGVSLAALGADGIRPSGPVLTVRAREVVLAAGAIGTPAILLRSGAADASGQTGKRTFLHPVVLSGAVMPEAIRPWQGAPQSVYSDEFLHRWPLAERVGYKLEVPPIHPVLLGTTLTGFGSAHREQMRQMPNLNVMLALTRDGFHPGSQGGQVRLRGDGSPLLDYPLTEPLWDAFRHAWLTMAELQFAAGAQSVLTVHEDAAPARTLAEAHAQLQVLPLEVLRARVVSAHVMGGAAMGKNEQSGVVDAYGRHWQYDNLTVVDGSVFPTSIGANPQLSVDAFAARSADALGKRLA